MARIRYRGWFLLILGSLAWVGFTPPAGACPFCGEKGPTLIGDFKQAGMVLFGRFTNAKLSPEGDFAGGSTDFVIEKVLKPHAILGKKKVLTLPRYVPKTRSKFLIFCDVYKGKVDPYRGVEVTTGGDIVKYLRGAINLKDQSIPARLRYCFDYLDDPELEIALDAYREFAVADYRDYRDMAMKLSPDKIARWLRDPKTPSYRFGLYASLLGHCGTAKHAKLLRGLIDNKDRRAGIDGMLAAYTMLKPKEGWAYIRNDLLAKPKADFQLRYSALRVVRFFWETRPDLVKKKDLVDGVCLLLDQPDMADFAIEDLRKWKVWQVSDRVLALADRKSHDLPVIHRSLLRFALSLPSKPPRAVKFIEAARKQDKEYVDDVEEALKLETETSGK
jgi:hypothetical protein